tara:strand:+ start:4309 stop:4812 length:504 start_codon:yes stop_codon:yes gene_type:complete
MEDELKKELDEISQRVVSAQKNIDDLSHISSNLKSATNTLSESAQDSKDLSKKFHTAIENLDSISTSAKQLYSILESTEANLNKITEKSGVEIANRFERTESSLRDSIKELSNLLKGIENNLNEVVKSNNDHLIQYSALLEKKFSDLKNLIFFLVGIIVVLAYFIFS